MPKTLTLRIDDQTYKSFLAQARIENRSLANFIETAAKTHVLESSFADDLEMEEIRNNKGLTARLKKGSRDARKKTGALIG